MERNGISLHQLGWPRTLQQRFCKRRDIALWVKTVGEKALGMTLDWKSDQYELLRIASVLDEERGKKTVMVALEEFKSENELSWKKGRKKK
jgi:transposase